MCLRFISYSHCLWHSQLINETSLILGQGETVLTWTMKGCVEGLRKYQQLKKKETDLWQWNLYPDHQAYINKYLLKVHRYLLLCQNSEAFQSMLVFWSQEQDSGLCSCIWGWCHANSCGCFDYISQMKMTQDNFWSVSRVISLSLLFHQVGLYYFIDSGQRY